MAIKPTKPNFKSFTFDGVNSRQYGVYITGGGVFNAPERNVEMIDIAGRNGSFVLDKGSFLNIEVTYPASIVADNETDFANAMSNLRNYLCSKVGYVRLEDDYNPNEYRMAVYKSGLDVDHDILTAGEFEIVFECKPQRFLKSGETATSVSSGSSIWNPTRFEARPQLQVKGYGNISINGNNLNVGNVPVGNISVPVSPAEYTSFAGFTATFPNTRFANGDSVAVTGKYVEVTFVTTGSYRFSSGSISNITNCSAVASKDKSSITVAVTIPDQNFVVGTSSTGTASSFRFSWYLTNSGGSGYTTISINTNYTYGDNRLAYTISSSASTSNINKKAKIISGNVFGYSNKPISDTINIDLDIGEVWASIGGEMTLLNNATRLPTELPTLSAGSNTITYDNTFTQFKIVPRWWQI